MDVYLAKLCHLTAYEKYIIECCASGLTQYVSEVKKLRTHLINVIYDYVDKVIVTCELNNEASKKVILACGGLYRNQIYSTEKQSHLVSSPRLRNSLNTLAYENFK